MKNRADFVPTAEACKAIILTQVIKSQVQVRFTVPGTRDFSLIEEEWGK